jgi:hypothetical protein
VGVTVKNRSSKWARPASTRPRNPVNGEFVTKFFAVNACYCEICREIRLAGLAVLRGLFGADRVMQGGFTGLFAARRLRLNVITPPDSSS